MSLSALPSHRRPTPSGPRRSSYIPWLFVAGLALVVAVNGVMTWFAIDSFSGLYVGEARERGVRFNDVIAEQKARDALGWRIESDWQADADRLAVTLSHADGGPLAGGIVSAELVRPAEKRPAVPLVLGELGDGHFAGTVDLPARGNWDLEIVVEAEGHRYGFTRRLFLK